MKSIFTGILFALAIHSYGQGNYSLADTAKSWDFVSGGLASCGVCCVHNYHIRLSQDTIINGNQYIKVFQTIDSVFSEEMFKGLLYEDTLNRKVFYRDLYGNEGLIYDFNVEVGDSIFIVNNYINHEVYLHCMMIDSVWIGDQARKRYAFSVEEPERTIEEYWIEDVGSMAGILNSGWHPAGGFRDFLCCHYNDSLIYINPHHQTCYKNEFYPYIIQDQLDTAFLNEYYFFQPQITDISEIDSVSWYDWTIPPGLTFDRQSGILEGIPIETGNFDFYIFLMNWDYPTDCIYDTLVIIDPTGISAPIFSEDFKISPNPCTDKVFIDLSLPKDILLSISVYDVNGSKILKKTGLSDSRIEIDCNDFPKGVYFVMVEDSKGRFSVRKKFVKM